MTQIVNSNDPEFTSFSPDGICEEGSLAAFIPIVFIIFFFVACKKLHKVTQACNIRDNTPGPISKIDRKDDGRFLRAFNNAVVLPFLPNSFETLVVIVFFLWFSMTITMGITRYYKGYWSQEFVAQQGPFNVIVNYLGCKGLDVAVISYKIPGLSGEPLNKRDSVFRKHLVAGTLWLTIGCIQIYRARSGWSTNKKLQAKMHRIFGWCCALPALFNHLYHASLIAYNNPANQTFPVQLAYVFIIADNAILAITGVWCMRTARAMIAAHEKSGKTETAVEKEIGKLCDKHKIRLGCCYFDSIFGSGPIRITAWILWLFAKFLPHDIALRVDRVVCQVQIVGGDASQCTVPVFLNLAFGGLLISWIRLIFISMPSVGVDEFELKMLKGRLRLNFLFTIFFIPMVLFPRLEEFYITSGLQILHTLLFRTLSLVLLVATPIKHEDRNNGQRVKFHAFFQTLVTGEENIEHENKD